MPAKRRKNLETKTGGALLSAKEDSYFISSVYPDSYVFPYNPDPLCSGNNYATYDEMLQDDQIKSVLSLKKNFITGTGWTVKCQDKEVRDYTAKMLQTLGLDSLNSNLEDSLNNILSAFEYGFSLSEPVFELTDEKLYKIKAIKTRPPHTFKFDIDEHGNVKRIIQETSKGSMEFSPDKFIHYTANKRFDNPYGLSDLQSAYTAWKLKKFFIRFFGIYCEKFAMPTVVSRYEQSMSKEEVDKMFEMLQEIQNNTVLTIPNSANVEFVQSGKDASDIYLRAIDSANMWIARALLVPDLMGISGSQNAGGSYNLGEKQFQVFMMNIKRDRESLQNKITNKVIKPVVQANFGDVECSFEFLPYSEGDLLEHSRLWLDAVKGGVVTPTAEELEHFKRTINYPSHLELDTPKDLASK
jgi:phage gp29-like protein